MTACTFCGQPIDGEPHYPHLDGCPRRTAEYVDREFVTCTCDTPPACPTCCGCEHGQIPGQLTIDGHEVIATRTGTATIPRNTP